MTQTNESKLKRLVMANMLWEDQFYVNGEAVATAIGKAIKACEPSAVAEIAQEARTKFKLRHVPLLLMRELARSSKLKAEWLTNVIQRPDEMGEFLAVYWKEGRTPVSNQVKKGLAKAFSKFNEYSLAKWDKNSAAIKLRDVMFISHPKPENKAQEELFQRIAKGTMETPDTWETELSAGANKRETFERLMRENKLGALAFLRNLRNMRDSGVPQSVIVDYSSRVDVSKVLPFRYIAAVRIVPEYQRMLEAMMLRSLRSLDRLPGKTALLVDVSGSMFGRQSVSNKSELNRFDAASALAMMCAEVCENVDLFSFSNHLVKIRPASGFAISDLLKNSQNNGGTATVEAMRALNSHDSYDRVIIFTDEQANGTYGNVLPDPKRGLGYVINVAAYEQGLEYRDASKWMHITGFSEAVIDFIQEVEKA